MPPKLTGIESSLFAGGAKVTLYVEGLDPEGLADLMRRAVELLRPPPEEQVPLPFENRGPVARAVSPVPDFAKDLACAFSPGEASVSEAVAALFPQEPSAQAAALISAQYDEDLDADDDDPDKDKEDWEQVWWSE